MSFKRNTVTREHLAKAIKRESNIPMTHALKLVDDIFDNIVQSLLSGNSVKLRMFGSFTTRRKNERVGRNPKNLVEAKIPARTVVKFKVAPTLKKRINSNIHMIHNV